ncbi:uncharacterized protein BXZ73DRAFT_51241 [Epithele typhae]|uniref:uncharacterized protein n=1 Tax=Epithele typhae TaxID=378194 RepID=UPI00200884EB|nr:uncharacterized protein BXZ73DRAFT_51241 [Epithele typhae]KAH9922847.1 hypothetical protein BXZ73DRAFT_51241 [Epithele typhae]
MAAPAEMTSGDLSGQYWMNKSLSDDTDDILRLQGMSWWTRQAIRMATVYLTVRHYKDDNGVEHIDIDQVLTGGIGASNEYRTLDWTERPHDDKIFGSVLSMSRRTPIENVEREWLKKDWLPETLADGQVINTIARTDPEKNGNKWSSEQTWGFEDIGGGKRYVRHVYFHGPGGEEINVRLVYDYSELCLHVCSVRSDQDSPLAGPV